MSDWQFDFRTGRLYCCIVYMKRAFIVINLNGPWLKLFKLGIDGKLFRIVKDMYSHVNVCVKSCKSYSQFFEYAVGLKKEQ
jgi:hypothetical protein